MYKISYVSDGTTTEFGFAFPFFQDADVHVAVNEVALDSNQYSVVANTDFSGGNVILASPAESGARIDIFRRISLSRVIDYQPTRRIDPEDLNADFNFLLAAFQDLKDIDVDLTDWANTHDNVKQFLDYTLSVINDKLSGGAVLGLYNNLLSVLNGALPKLINDYGSICEPADTQFGDDYGIL